MPGPHREFLELMKGASNLRPYVLSLENDLDVRRLYDEAVLRLTALRDCHLRVVARYIIIPAGKEFPTRGHIHLQEHGRGTGGTDMMKFLRTTRDTTKSACCEHYKGSTPVQASPIICKSCSCRPTEQTAHL